MKLKSFSVLLIILAILVLVFSGIYYLWQSRNAVSFLNQAGNNSSSSQTEVKQAVEKVGKLILLPTETPVMAKVTDPAKLSGQVFFKHASAGDIILMYKGAKEAILYDPVKNLIINVAPLNLEEPTPTPVIITTHSNARVVIYYNPNGQGYDANLENQLAKEKHINILRRVKANQDYSQMQVVVLNKSFAGQASKLANDLKVSLSTQVPSGASSQTADILIIAGQ